jgi:phage-related minor tail protein
MASSPRDLTREILNITNRIEDKIDDQLKDYNTRITALEKFQNKALGVLVIVSAVFSILLNYLWERILG